MHPSLKVGHVVTLMLYYLSVGSGKRHWTSTHLPRFTLRPVLVQAPLCGPHTPTPVWISLFLTKPMLGCTSSHQALFCVATQPLP